MSTHLQNYMKGFINDVMKAQNAFTEAQARNCSKPVLDILAAHLQKRLDALNEALGKLP